MEIIFAEARAKRKFKLSDNALKLLPKNIGLCSSIQFLDSLEGIKKQLKGSGRNAELITANNTPYKGQILGCSKFKNLNFDAVLYIGDGVFHPLQLKSEFKGDVFTYNPFSKTIKKIENIKKYKKREQGMLIKFLNATNIGIIISTKPGQKFGNYKALIKNYPEKKFYKFLFDTIDFEQLKNFNFVNVWVNTACPRIGFEDSFENKLNIINIERIEEMQDKT